MQVQYYARIRIRRIVCVYVTWNANGPRKTRAHTVYYNKYLILYYANSILGFIAPPQCYNMPYYYTYRHIILICVSTAENEVITIMYYIDY